MSNSSDDMLKKLHAIAELAAVTYSERDLHNISDTERQLVQKLEESGFLKAPGTQNGFAGKAISFV